MAHSKPLQPAQCVLLPNVAEEAFGAVIGGLSDLSMLAGVAMGLGAAGVKALLDQQDRLRELQDNHLYFYYGARELLKRPEQEA